MPTDKPRIQAYIEPDLYEKLKEYQQERGLKESPALNEILREYFGMESQPSILPEQIEARISARIDEEINKQWNEFNLFRVELKNEIFLQMKKEFFIWNESLAKAASAIVDFNSRLETLEAAVKPIEGLAEISKPLAQGEAPRQPEAQRIFTPGTIVKDAEGNFGLVIGHNNLGMRIDWLGLGNCPNPASGKGIWYDWKKDKDAILSFSIATAHPRIKLLTTEEFLQLQQWDKEKLDELWGGKWAEDEYGNQYRWGGATIDQWVFIFSGELPSEPSNLPSKLNLTQLARRLNVAKSVVSNRKARADFQEWSKTKDPDGLAWQCRKEGQWLKFYPVEDRV